MESSNRIRTLFVSVSKQPLHSRYEALKQSRLIVLVLLLLLVLPRTRPIYAQADEGAVVQAILFYSPTCPHCHQVLREVLQPLAEQYGDQLQIMAIDTTQEAGGYLYQRAVIAFEVPDEVWVVPMLFVGEGFLVGADQIEEQFPTTIEEGLEAGGIGWPDIPELTDIVPDLPPSAGPDDAGVETAIQTPSPAAEPVATDPPAPLAPTVTAEPTAAGSDASAPEAGSSESAPPAQPQPTPTGQGEPIALSLEGLDLDEESFSEQEPPPDPVGFALGWTVLIILVFILLYGSIELIRARAVWLEGSPRLQFSQYRKRLLQLLLVIGLLVSIYLSYVEVTQIKAACGPVGQCNLVQSSPYAQIMGVPVALLGTLFYLTLGSFLFLAPRLEGQPRRLLSWALLALTLFGVLFSIYLTSLELLVIHAVCAYCLTSALVTVALFFLVTQLLTNRQTRFAQ